VDLAALLRAPRGRRAAARVVPRQRSHLPRLRTPARGGGFSVERLPPEDVAGEHCTMLRALPREERAYAAVVLAVAADHAILEHRYFGATRPPPTA
jgi:hypothetical protein